MPKDVVCATTTTAITYGLETLSVNIYMLIPICYIQYGDRRAMSYANVC